MNENYNFDEGYEYDPFDELEDLEEDLTFLRDPDIPPEWLEWFDERSFDQF